MAGMTLADIRNKAMVAAGVFSHDAMFQTVAMNDLVNQAVAMAEAEVRGPWRQVTTTVQVSAVQPDITLPADWAETKGVFDGHFELTEVSITDLYAYGPSNISGAPEVWAQDADRIRLAPPPSSTISLTLIYYRQPPVLVSDNDQTLMPADLAMQTIVPKVAELIHLRQGERVLADAKATEYLQGVARLRKRARGSTRPMRVRIRSGGWI